MTNGSQVICAAAVIGAWGDPRALGDNSPMPDGSLDLRSSRLRKHADYQRVYKESRKHFSPSMSYFFRRREDERGDEVAAGSEAPGPARVGLTAGRVLGKAVERNRIKRRMREAVRMNLSRLPGSVDVVLHPRKSVIDMEFRKLSAEVARIFSTVSSEIEKRSSGGIAKKPGGPR
jgi:ribonuclease P protein component